MKLVKQITNGVLLIVIGLLHTYCAVSSGGCGKQFMAFSKTCFFKVSSGLAELPAEIGRTNFESFAAFWFFYFGILLIPLGLLVHSIEKGGKTLPLTFTLSYLLFVLVGCYMIPNSGMTVFMLPQAIYMVVSNYFKARKTENN